MTLLDGLFYLMSVIGIGVVMWWAISNDGTPPDGRTTGLLAMRETSVGRAARKAAAKPWRR